MQIRKKRPRLEVCRVRLDELNMDSPFLPPVDDRLVQLIADVMAGKAPHWVTTVPLADLGVHHPPTLAALRANPEYSQMRGATLKLLRDNQPNLMAFRDENGHLVMFDDYLFYAVALDANLTMINVYIVGEAAPISTH